MARKHHSTAVDNPRMAADYAWQLAVRLHQSKVEDLRADLRDAARNVRHRVEKLEASLDKGERLWADRTGIIQSGGLAVDLLAQKLVDAEDMLAAMVRQDELEAYALMAEMREVME